jgi:hypothetical protein
MGRENKTSKERILRLKIGAGSKYFLLKMLQIDPHFGHCSSEAKILSALVEISTLADSKFFVLNP